MSHAIERMRQQHIKALVGRHVVRRRRQSDMADMAEAEPEEPLPDAPLHKRGFGVSVRALLASETAHLDAQIAGVRADLSLVEHQLFIRLALSGIVIAAMHCWQPGHGG